MKRLYKKSNGTSITVDIFDSKNENSNIITLQLPMDNQELKNILKNNNMENSYEINEIIINYEPSYNFYLKIDIYSLNEFAKELVNLDKDKYTVLFSLIDNGYEINAKIIKMANEAKIYNNIKSINNFLQCTNEIEDNDLKINIEELLMSSLNTNKFINYLEENNWYYDEFKHAYFHIN